MKYRSAKNLHNGDEVIRKEDSVSLRVVDVEVYGQYKKVRLNCVDNDNAPISLFNDEVL